MQGETFVITLHDRQGGEARRVGGAASQHYLRAGFQRADEGLDAGLGNDVRRRVDGFVGEWRDEIKRNDLACVERSVHRGLGDIGRNDRHAESELFFAGDLENDLAAPFEMRFGARAPAVPTTTGMPASTPALIM